MGDDPDDEYGCGDDTGVVNDESPCGDDTEDEAGVDPGGVEGGLGEDPTDEDVGSNVT